MPVVNHGGTSVLVSPSAHNIHLGAVFRRCTVFGTSVHADVWLLQLFLVVAALAVVSCNSVVFHFSTEGT